MRLSSSTGAMPSYGGGWPLELQESTATGVIDEREQALYKEAETVLYIRIPKL